MARGCANYKALEKLEATFKVRDKDYYVPCDKRDLEAVGYDLGLWAYYGALKDYAKRLPKDKHGYTRISSSFFMKDLHTERTKVWRYNKKLADKGLISVDRVARGGRTWIGVKLI